MNSHRLENRKRKTKAKQIPENESTKISYTRSFAELQSDLAEIELHYKVFKDKLASSNTTLVEETDSELSENNSETLFINNADDFLSVKDNLANIESRFKEIKKRLEFAKVVYSGEPNLLLSSEIDKKLPKSIEARSMITYDEFISNKWLASNFETIPLAYRLQRQVSSRIATETSSDATHIIDKIVKNLKTEFTENLNEENEIKLIQPINSETHFDNAEKTTQCEQTDCTVKLKKKRKPSRDNNKTGFEKMKTEVSDPEITRICHDREVVRGILLQLINTTEKEIMKLKSKLHQCT